MNLAYLIEHELVYGEIYYAMGGAGNARASKGITGKGMDIVESFVEQCEKDLGKSKKILKKTLSYSEKITELVLIWAENIELYQQAIELLMSLIIKSPIS